MIDDEGKWALWMGCHQKHISIGKAFLSHYDHAGHTVTKYENFNVLTIDNKFRKRSFARYEMSSEAVARRL